MTLRRYVMRVRAEDLEHAYDVLLPALPRGLHELDDGDRVALVALGEDGELPPVEEVARALDELLLEPIAVEDAGPSLGAALAVLRRSWDVGGRVVLRAAEQPPPVAGRLDVVLDRSSGGFGTGAHPTTRHCLELLLDIEPGGAFADLGCGAGALTIAAAKLGFAPVTGVELLEGAAAAATGNVRTNGVDVTIVQGDLLARDPPPARVAVINVSELPVHERLASWAWPGGEALVVSGLSRPEQLAHALEHYAAAGWTERARVDREGWPAVLLERDLQRG